MTRSLDRFLLSRLLPRLLSNACPATVSRVGGNAAQVNCFTTTVRDGGEPRLVPLRLANGVVEGLEFDGNRYTIDATVPLAGVDPAMICVTHFYGEDEVRYEGIRSVALGLWMRLPYVWLRSRRAWNAVAQHLFNRRTLASKRRLDMLREVIDATTDGADGVDAMDLMSLRYGYRWASHREGQAHHHLIRAAT